jgi:hypothetical protein
MPALPEVIYLETHFASAGAGWKSQLRGQRTHRPRGPREPACDQRSGSLCPGAGLPGRRRLGASPCLGACRAEPSGWSEETWRYEQLAFAACLVPASDLAILCAGGGAIAVGQIQAVVPAVQGPANWTRQPSFARHDRLLLPWPTTEYTISGTDSGRQLPHDMLAGGSCPSFPEPFSAWRAFCEGDYSLSGAGAPPSQLAVLRFAEDTAWIGRVRVTPTQLAVEVHGTAVDGAELELNGVTGRSTQPLTGPGTVVFPLERGLPASAWIWLKRDTTWLDYRSVDSGSGWTGELARADVEFDIPVEPQANIEALLAAGEGPQIEYKRQLPATAEQKRKMLKTAAAFATCDGGTMVFGMDPDEVTVTGLGPEDPKILRDQLYDLVHRTVVPSPDVTVTDYQIDRRTDDPRAGSQARPGSPIRDRRRQGLSRQARVLRAPGIQHVPRAAGRTAGSRPQPTARRTTWPLRAIRPLVSPSIRPWTCSESTPDSQTSPPQPRADAADHFRSASTAADAHRDDRGVPEDLSDLSDHRAR